MESTNSHEIPSSRSEYIQSHHEIAQLMGHPLPSLCYLPLTSSTTKPTSDSLQEIDLFIQSLSKPILLFLHSNSSPLTMTYFNFLDQDLIKSWKAKEPELQLYALSTQSSQTQRDQLNLLSQSSSTKLWSIFNGDTQNADGLKLLSDSKLEFTNFLGLPTFNSTSSSIHTSPAEGKDGKSLKNLILLLRGGQITRLYLPTINDKQENISRRIFEMLIPDEDLA